MKILHTSDWHLGRSFGTYGLLPDQEAFLHWLVTTAVSNGVELVAVAGDIYDRTNPPADAIRVFNTAVVALNRAGIEVAAIAGNHDSAERVAVYAEFTEANGLLLRGGYPATPVGKAATAADVVVREFSDGPLAIAAIPFLDPRMIPSDFTLLDPASGPYTHHQVVEACATAAAEAIPRGMRSLAMAHGFIAGGKGSDSEKKLVASVGNSDHISADCFAPFSYSALGHLHRPQAVAGSPTIRYSGTPLPYSFSETGTKSIALVDMDPRGGCDVSLLEVPIGKGVRTVRGSFAEISRMEADCDNLIRIELTDAAPVREAKRRLLPQFPHVVELSLVNVGASIPAGGAGSANSTISLVRQVVGFLGVATGQQATVEDFHTIVNALSDAGLETPDASEVLAELSTPLPDSAPRSTHSSGTTEAA